MDGDQESVAYHTCMHMFVVVVVVVCFGNKQPFIHKPVRACVQS